MAQGHPGAFGRIVRVPLKTDYRIFVPTPRSSPSFERAYNKRTAAERFNSRIDNVLGFEDHTIAACRRCVPGWAGLGHCACHGGGASDGRPAGADSLARGPDGSRTARAEASGLNPAPRAGRGRVGPTREGYVHRSSESGASLP